LSTRILAMDTTGEFGSLALAEDEKVVDTILLHSPDGFAHVLFDHIRVILRRRNLALCDIDCFAAASGPGSFTGVRVGLAACKGLAEACGKSVAAVSNLQALAAGGSAPLRAAVIDARRGEVYSAAFSANLEAVVPETVGNLSQFLESLPAAELEFLSTDTFPLQKLLTGTRFAKCPVRNVERALASLVARIAWIQSAGGETLDPAAVDANYVRRSDAELFSKN
jgi:tRNA threonylcarbamoyladenosine biosynthesis protein TsaB